VADEKLKRERAGTYRTADGRFTVEQTSSGWLLMDAEQTDELGLALARGPFGTLDEARAAIAEAREGPAPESTLRAGSGRPKLTALPGGAPGGPKRAPRRAPPPRRQEVVIREFRIVDGDGLRTLWRDSGFGELGDDDRSLARLARRNPGLLLVAADGSRIVGSALGAWDGRRGWIYHVATARSHRRQGIATKLVDQVERALVALGCPKANVVVRPDSDGGDEFWTNRGYAISPARHYGKKLAGP
jgi:GNAT superfamily N-acetyltransferase